MYHPCGEHRDPQCPASTYGCIPSSAENHDTRTEGVHTRVNTGVASGAQATRSSAARYCLLDKWQRENAPDTYEATFLQRQTSSPPAFSALFQPSSPSPENDACLECDETVNASYITFPPPPFYLDNTLQNPFLRLPFRYEFNIRSTRKIRYDTEGTIPFDSYLVFN